MWIGTDKRNIVKYGQTPFNRTLGFVSESSIDLDTEGLPHEE
jgi:hypothetical protein